ncbi:MAG TPA: DNA primase, partial [Planctomycetaceae bacterium]|nr:DNA primase [Planctomycetaceae bacterium]
MQNEGVNFREALEILAEQANVPLRRSNQAPAKPGSPNDKSTLYEAVAWAESLFHEYLLKSQDAELARRYLEARGITQESLQRWHIGFAPNQFNWIADRARTTKFSPEVLLAAGLLRKSERQTYYD